MVKENRTEFIRVIKDRDYTVIHNQFLKRKDLSWKAKGILAYILSLPDDWNINLKEVMTNATEGEAAFRSGWKELTEKGYVNRQPVKDKKTKRIKYWDTKIYEKVDMKVSEPHGDFPNVEKPNVGKPNVDNRKLQSTDSTKYLNKQSTDSEVVKEEIPYKEIIEHLNEKTDKKISFKTKGNRDLIKARWNEGYSLDDFKQVIDNKVSDWLGTGIIFTNGKSAEDYLHPTTLFRPKNFDKYLNQSSPKKKKEMQKPRHDYSLSLEELEKMMKGEN